MQCNLGPKPPGEVNCLWPRAIDGLDATQNGQLLAWKGSAIAPLTFCFSVLMRRVGGGGSIRTVTLARTTMKIGLASLAIDYVNYVLRLLSDSQPPLRMAKTTERRHLEKVLNRWL